MIRSLEMLGGVLVPGRIATPHMAAFKADAQVNPCIADLEAILAAFCRRLDVPDLIEVAASGWHLACPAL